LVEIGGVLRMKFTSYYHFTKQRPDRAKIQEAWIMQTITSPIKTEVQADGRIRKWGYIMEENKYLRVILLSDGETVHNAFFDRNFEEEDS
jgi:hypothetical protein